MLRFPICNLTCVSGGNSTFILIIEARGHPQDREIRGTAPNDLKIMEFDSSKSRFVVLFTWFGDPPSVIISKIWDTAPMSNWNRCPWASCNNFRILPSAILDRFCSYTWSLSKRLKSTLVYERVAPWDVAGGPARKEGPITA